jgi:hypothetical protein
VQVTSIDFIESFVKLKVGVVLRTFLCSLPDTSCDVKAGRGLTPSQLLSWYCCIAVTFASSALIAKEAESYTQAN